MIVHVPVVRNVAVVPDTVQTLVVDDVKVTGSPELAEATSVNGVPTVCVPIELNVMVWL